eukprot:872705-Prorocentrum_minimum.AAC.1
MGGPIPRVDGADASVALRSLPWSLQLYMYVLHLQSVVCVVVVGGGSHVHNRTVRVRAGRTTARCQADQRLERTQPHPTEHQQITTTGFR